MMLISSLNIIYLSLVFLSIYHRWKNQPSTWVSIDSLRIVESCDASVCKRPHIISFSWVATIVVWICRWEALISSAKFANFTLDPASLRLLCRPIILARKTFDALIAIHVWALMWHVLIWRKIPWQPIWFKFFCRCCSRRLLYLIEP